MTRVKEPACYDVSHWKEVSDFRAISPRPLLMITKATEGDTYVDDKFVRFMAGMKAAGLNRGCYHFHRKAKTPNNQALLFCNFIEPYIDDNTFLFLDVEEGGETAAQLKKWFELVHAIYPKNPLMLYSSKLILDKIVMTAEESAFFRNIHVWTAGYPWFPDLFDTVPGGYIPDRKRYGPVDLWQYAKGLVTGIEGDTDLNWISPTFQEVLRNLTDVSQEETENPMAKNSVTITYTDGARERKFPHAEGEYRNILPCTSVHYSDVDPRPDMDDPNNPDKQWILLQSGWYIATRYPSSSGIVQRAVVAPIPVAESAPVVDGSFDFVFTNTDGKKYHGTVMINGLQMQLVEYDN